MNEGVTMTVGSQSYADAAKQMELLLHSLTHEDTRENYSRQQLVLSKWCRDFHEGFFIRDLTYVVEILRILRDRLQSHHKMFRPILSSVLSIASLPLFEAKANERLRTPSLDIVKQYFYELTQYWSEDDIPLNVEITKCFRCVVNGGLDPSILQADIKDSQWVSDGLRLQVNDKSYLQTQLLESGSVASLIASFQEFTRLYEIEFDKHSQALEAASALQREKEKMMKKGAHTNADDSDSDEDVSAAADTEKPNDTGTTTSGAGASDAKEILADYQDLLNGMRQMFMELTVDNKTSAEMARCGCGDGLIRLLKIAASSSPRDPQVSFTVDVLWTILDAYLGQVPPVGSVTTPTSAASPMTFDAGDGNGCMPVTFQSLTAVRIMDFEGAIKVLLKLFKDLLDQGYRMADKECRNETLVVMSMIASFPAAFPCFMSTGALTTFLTYACVPELGDSTEVWPFYDLPIAKMRNFGTVHDIDLQLKRGLWLIIGDIVGSDDPDALLAVASSPLMDNLLGYLEFNSLPEEHNSIGSPSRGSQVRSQSQVVGDSAVIDGQESSLATGSPTRGGSTNQNQGEGVADGSQISYQQSLPGYQFLRQLPHNQLLELQVQAASFLAANAPKVLGEFLRIQGPVRFLDIAHKYSKSQISEHKNLVYMCLLLLNRCLMLSQECQDIMENENAIETFLTQFEYADEEDTRTIVARLISILCSGDNVVCQEQLRSQNGISLLVNILAQYAENRRTQVGRKAGLKLNAVHEAEDGPGGTTEESKGGSVSIMLVAILDCLCKGVSGNNKSEIILAKVEGVDALLNILEVSQMLQRVQILRLLSDLLENRKLLSFLHAWRSPKTMRPAAQVIAHCWLDEEARLGVSREQGILNNICDPLRCHAWPEDSGGMGVQEPGQSLSSIGSTVASMKSLAVTRLSEAISKAQVINGVVPGELRDNVLSKDTRVIIARILVLIGVVEAYNATPPGFVGAYHQMDLGLGEGSNIVLEQDSSLLIAPAGAGEPSATELPTSADGFNESKSPCPEPGPDMAISLDDANGPVSPLNVHGVNTQSYEEQGGFGVGASASQVPTVIISNDPGLNPSDRQVVAIANQYGLLREGEWWKSVAEDLQGDGVDPIEADQALIQDRLKAAFNAAFIVQSEQMELHGQEIDAKKETEDAFLGQVLAKKDQQIKTMYLKKKGKGGTTANPHATRPY